MVNNSKKNLSIFPASITKMFSFFKKKKFTKKHKVKLTLAKVFTFIIIFVLIFDKATILFVIYLYGLYSYWQPKNKENYTNNNNNALVSTIFEPSNNTIASLSRVFKNPELNLKSYTNVKIDPTKVLFEDNKFLPECCFYNSEYSTSKGCPCITGDQQNYLNARGTNKSHISFLQTNNDYKNKYFSPTLAFQGAHVPFKTNEEHYIIDHEPLAPEKKTEFNSLINNY